MTSRYRNALPQLGNASFLTDAGLETDLIFNHDIEIREFAAHTLLPDATGRRALENYLRGFLALAREHGAGFILDSQTWKAHRHWANDLGVAPEALRRTNHEAIEFIAGLRDEAGEDAGPIVLNAVVGPRGDAYAPETLLSVDEARDYHAEQIGWLAETDADMITALTFTQSDEASGIVQAANAVNMPIVVSFTVETDGRLPTGEPVADAIRSVDAATNEGAAYFMINCAHPTTSTTSGATRTGAGASAACARMPRAAATPNSTRPKRWTTAIRQNSANSTAQS